MPDLPTRLQEIRARLAQATPPCESPDGQPESLVTRDMAIDAGDADLEGSVHTPASWERCGACPGCMAIQDLTFLCDILDDAMKVVEAADKIAQVRLEPFASWEMVQDLREALSDFTQRTEAEG